MGNRAIFGTYWAAICDYNVPKRIQKEQALQKDAKSQLFASPRRQMASTYVRNTPNGKYVCFNKREKCKTNKKGQL